MSIDHCPLVKACPRPANAITVYDGVLNYLPRNTVKRWCVWNKAPRNGSTCAKKALADQERAPSLACPTTRVHMMSLSNTLVNMRIPPVYQANATFLTRDTIMNT